MSVQGRPLRTRGRRCGPNKGQAPKPGA